MTLVYLYKHGGRLCYDGQETGNKREKESRRTITFCLLFMSNVFLFLDLMENNCIFLATIMQLYEHNIQLEQSEVNRMQ